MRNRAFKWLSHACRIVLGVTFIFSGIRQDRRSVGYGDQDTGVPFDLRAGIAERSAFRLFDLAVRRRADDGAHAAFQGAHPADLDFRAGFDGLLHGADLPERHVAAGRGLRLFRRCRQAHAVGDVRQKIWCCCRCRSSSGGATAATVSSAFSKAEVGCTVLFFSLAMGLGIYCYAHLPLIDFRPFQGGGEYLRGDERLFGGPRAAGGEDGAGSIATGRRGVCTNFRSTIPSGRMPGVGSGSIPVPKSSTSRRSIPRSRSSRCAMPKATPPSRC